MDSGKTAVFYVDLASLLDLRLATIEKNWPGKAEEALKSGYLDRETHWWDGVPREEFEKKYLEYDPEVLQYSTVTRMVEFFRELCKGLSKEATLTPDLDGVLISINIYPYQMSQEVKDEIGRAAAVWFEHLAGVEIVNIPLVYLTPELVKSRYAGMVMYDWNEWMNIQAPRFAECRPQSVYLYGPALYFATPPNEEEITLMQREGKHPFGDLEEVARAIIKLELIPPMYYNALVDDVQF